MQLLETTPSIANAKTGSMIDVMTEGCEHMFKHHHHFAGGVYTREMVIKPNVVMVGRMHKGETTNVITKGSLLLYVPGKEPVYMQAPHTFITKPGTQKIFYTFETVHLLNLFPDTGERDPDRLADHFAYKMEDTMPVLDDANQFTRFLIGENP